MAHKRLITFMLATMLATATLTGCSDGRDSVELKYEDEIRELLEYDANTNISKDNVKKYGLELGYEIIDAKFYITFVTKKPVALYGHSYANNDVKIKYEVDKDTYYDFKNHYNIDEKLEDVERVKSLTEKYDPVEVINPTVNNVEK